MQGVVESLKAGFDDREMAKGGTIAAAYGAAGAAMAASLFSEPVYNITLEFETVESRGCCLTGLAYINIAPLKYLIMVLNHEVLNHCSHYRFSLFNAHQSTCLKVQDIYDLPSEPYQPHHLSFPSHKFGKSSPVYHSFQVSWFNRFSWIHYDVPREAAFCFICC